jgi:site-specific DNA recombinase
MLRNPAYKGQACFGKTAIAPRQRITRPIRMRGGIASRNSAHHERPREDWITIPVPPIVREEIFALAQERLEANKTHAPRRTVTPSVVQGLESCAKCGYALYRTSTRSSARAIHYYRCLGSDGWRRLSSAVCSNRPVRQDLLDEVVWTEIVRLLEDPQLIQNELDRRLAAAREADPSKRREQALRRDLARIRKSIDRLLTAYQEGLLSLDELRERMPNLRRREQADNAELQAIVEQSADRAGYLRLAASLPLSLRDCGRRRRTSTPRNASVSCGFSSRKSLSAMTKSLFGIPSPCPPELTTLQLEARMVPHPAVRVMYCVRGASSAPWAK